MQFKQLLFFVLAGCVFLGCQNTPHKKTTTLAGEIKTITPDPHSYSRHDSVKVKHLNLDLEVNFKDQILDGHAVISYQLMDVEAKHLILDTRDLKIKRIETTNDSKNKKLSWRFGQQIDGLGTELIIELPKDNTPIKIHYQTRPEASGLQWLSAAQTSGKTHPFLFSQSQSIHARSWIPIQDTPAVRVTYDAIIRTKDGVIPVLSADNNNQQSKDGNYYFTMKQAIPAYLIAIAVGDLKHQKISEHVTVYAEEEVLASAVHEFAETENMITATESLYGPYRWGQYDLLVLPPSFPFGGMENPKLSHITPTIIAGDRSLDSLIAHELAHSWSGNLVTNALWKDAWLNEGFTSYIEARIIDAIYGKDRMMMESTLIYHALIESMKELTPEQQKLLNQTPSSDPDDFFSSVSYDKGRFFLEWIEQQVGREAFDHFLNKYFDHFAFQSLATEDFVSYLTQHLIANHSDKITSEQVHIWLNNPGIPNFFTAPTTQRFVVIENQVQQWIDGAVAAKNIDSAAWTTQEWLHFLRTLPTDLSHEKMQMLDEAFEFTTRQNSEIAHDWLLISIRNEYQPAYGRLINYLSGIGRVKLIKPLYQALMENDELHNLATNIYRKARPGYHNIATAQIDEILKYAAPEKTD